MCGKIALLISREPTLRLTFAGGNRVPDVLAHQVEEIAEARSATRAAALAESRWMRGRCGRPLHGHAHAVARGARLREPR